MIFDYILENGSITAQKAMEITRLTSTQGARKALSRLGEAKLIKQSGSGKRTYYEEL